MSKEENKLLKEQNRLIRELVIGIHQVIEGKTKRSMKKTRVVEKEKYLHDLKTLKGSTKKKVSHATLKANLKKVARKYIDY